jgi:hypothetical protein
MSPFNHHASSSYLQAYAIELADDMRGTRTTRGHHSLRHRIGQSMVAMGAWIAHGSTTMVDGRLVILERRENHDLPRAA